jgi:hypothetical protein
MGERIDDEMLDAFAIVAEPEDVGARLAERYGDVLDTWLCTHALPDPRAQRAMVESLQRAR